MKEIKERGGNKERRRDTKNKKWKEAKNGEERNKKRDKGQNMERN